MDFWSAFHEELVAEGFSKSRLSLQSRERVHSSLSAVVPYSTSIDVNQCAFRKYSEEGRYVLAKNVTTDLLISIYDANSSSALLLRMSSPLGSASLSKLKAAVGRFRSPNFEVRLIGLQDNVIAPLESIGAIRKFARFRLLEADLFGGQMRHIAFDLKLGVGFDLLLQDRIYEPGELVIVSRAGIAPKAASELAFI